MSLDIYFYDTVKCEKCGHEMENGEQVYWKNITHNLTRMATEAGIYNCLWYPDQYEFTHVRHIIGPIEQAIRDMEKDPERFKPFSATNGWGTYEQFLPWLKELLIECKQYPDCKISVSR